MSSFEIYRLCQKTAPSRVNGLSKPQASLLHVVCACNYIRLPLTRQHKPSVFVSRFTSSRRFLKISKNFQTSPFDGFLYVEWANAEFCIC